VPPDSIAAALRDLAEALVIGLIVGVQREASHPKNSPGVRDFLIIALTGGICGFLENTWLTAAALLAVTVLLAVYYFQTEDHSGITTEMAAVATFCLAVLATSPSQPVGSGLAVGAAVVVVVLLEAKRSLHRFIRETLTEAEFSDTLWFLAVIFIVYPILPEGEFGPYGAFSPQRVWGFVILVSSISFVGYFLQKYLGSAKGLVWTSILGGLASTTAATLEFARESAAEPARRREYWAATVIANAIQFPRVLAILYLFSQSLALATAPMLLTMSAAGLLLGAILRRRSGPGVDKKRVTGRNPFRLTPALKFGMVFAAVTFLSKAASTEFGGQGLFWASAAGGLVDADAVAVSLAGISGSNSVAMATTVPVLYLALAMNGLLKSVLAFYSGGTGFGWRVLAGFVVMFGAGSVFWLL